VKKTLQCKDDMDIYMGIYEAWSVVNVW
jgi:hypothetical protein